jgi:DNA mismatch repair ATPase MutS
LIPKGIRVGNGLRLAAPGEVLIITGSNMSGKSTLMRALGANLVLAYAGGPVCAAALRCGRVEMHTSMRLKDDLEKRVSSFYAELLRIKGIVEAAQAGRQVLFLIDEIFRGTNSKDRHAGAMAVLRQLHGLKAAGLVSTHDSELARLEEMEPGSFRNFHFQERYEEGRISFDYRMRAGVSTTTNAMHLLRMVGLGGA